MNIFLTGADGYIGKHLAIALEDQGHKVYRHDIGRPFVCKGIDIVYHLGAHSRAHESVKDPSLAIRNISFTYEVLEWMRLNRLDKIVFSSSREALSLESPYGASKAASEALIESYCKSYGFGAVSLRLPNIYGGTGEHPDRFVPLTFHKALNDKKIIIYGGKEKILNFVYIDDCVKVLVDMSGYIKLTSHDILSLATIESNSLYSIAKMIVRFTKSKSKIKCLPNRNGETLVYRPPVENTIHSTGSIEEGLRKCIT